MTDGKPIILVCDDTEEDCKMVRRYLPDQYRFESVEDIAHARNFLANQHVYLALVDLYLDKEDRTPFGIEILDEFQHVPMVLMSGQNPDRVLQALSRSKYSQLQWLSKEEDLCDGPSVASKIDECLQQYYNLELDFDFKHNSVNWESIATRLAGADAGLRAQFTQEVKHLAQRLFFGWDIHKHAHVRVARIHVVKELTSGAHSCVLLLQPHTISHETQADVIFKISKLSPQSTSEHHKFNEFKNLVGGYGLRERRYMRTCHLQGQVYAVPYYGFDETKTFAEYYRSLAGGSENEAALGALSEGLFNNTLHPLNFRPRTSRQPAIVLSEYYAQRIKAPQREEAIRCDLTPDRAPAHLRVRRDVLEVRVNGEVCEFKHPAPCVLGRHAYKHVDDRVSTAIRHGDFHASNVLVDEHRRMCWFIDYEQFDVDHFALVDHVEFEASVLFDLMDIGAISAGYLVRFINAITQPRLNQIEDAAGADMKPRDKIESGKALAVIRAIRESADEVNGLEPARHYYHALLYEALRVTGRRDTDTRTRWHVLLAAAVLLKRLEES